MTQQERARGFRRLHSPEAGRTLVLPNAWDAMSARLIEEAGAPAIATTSAGVSWALGRPDGHGLTRDEMLEALSRITASVHVPVTADVEGGYGRGTVEDVAETVRSTLAAGAVGINLEDSPGAGGALLIDADHQARRIAAARAAARQTGIDLFINARIDVYLFEVGAPEERFDETVRRAHAYTAAGADGVFVPGVTDATTIRRLVDEVRAPLNVMADAGAPTISELHALGVARVSLGPAITRSAMAHVRRAVLEVLGAGTYDALNDALPFPDADRLFARA